MSRVPVVIKPGDAVLWSVTVEFDGGPVTVISSGVYRGITKPDENLCRVTDIKIHSIESPQGFAGNFGMQTSSNTVVFADLKLMKESWYQK